jgi:glycosyltransferase involved in cell wall biosynthesis
LRISVVICTHSPRVALLRRAVEAIIPQLGRVDGSELLIVDNASADPMAVLAFAAEPGVRVVVEPRLGLTSARECAAREAKGEIVIFVDDDNILDADYLAQAIALFSDHSIGVLSGRVEAEYEAVPPTWLLAHERALAIRYTPDGELRLVSGFRYSADFPIGAGMVIRRAVLRSYFSASKVTGRIEGRRGNELLAGEDTDIALFAISEGLRIGSSGGLRLKHVIPPWRMTSGYIMRLNRGALRSAALVNAKWRSRFGADVFDFLSQSTWRVLARCAAFAALAFSTGFRVRAVAQWDLLRLKVRLHAVIGTRGAGVLGDTRN